jgi:N-acetylglutamate synthase-like GNAT family acetyltransferase
MRPNGSRESGADRPAGPGPNDGPGSGAVHRGVPPLGPVSYRFAEPGDAPTLVTLLEEMIADHGAISPERDRLLETVDSVLAAGGQHRFLLAETREGIVGMCAMLFSMSTWSAAKACELQDVMVSPTARRSGVGRALVETAGRLAQEEGCRRVFLLAEAWNLEAHAFYRALGFNEKTCLAFERDLRV